MKREEGFYWVKLNNSGKWEPAEWKIAPESWWVIGESIGYEEDEIMEIGEKIFRKE